jgi:hypothetical protein
VIADGEHRSWNPIEQARGCGSSRAAIDRAIGDISGAGEDHRLLILRDRCRDGRRCCVLRR